MPDLDRGERRRHLRCTVYEPCRVVAKGTEYDGAAVDMSVGDAAIRLDVQLEVQPPAGTPIVLYIERIGRIPASVVRPLVNGFAVEFRVDRNRERHLVAALRQVLDDYPAATG